MLFLDNVVYNHFEMICGFDYYFMTHCFNKHNRISENTFHKIINKIVNIDIDLNNLYLLCFSFRHFSLKSFSVSYCSYPNQHDEKRSNDWIIPTSILNVLSITFRFFISNVLYIRRNTFFCLQMMWLFRNKICFYSK